MYVCKGFCTNSSNAFSALEFTAFAAVRNALFVVQRGASRTGMRTAPLIQVKPP